MTWHQRTIWSEGLFLEPQHFQQHDRYLEHLVHAHGRLTEPWNWGFAACMLDETALGLGKVAFASATGMLADGTPFSFPDEVPAPAPLDIPADARNEMVVLALPLARRGAKEVDAAGGSHDGLRYVAFDMSAGDITSDTERTAQLRVGLPNLQLLLERDATDAFTTIGVARILERRADNRVVLDTHYVPPMLHALAHPVLAGYVHRLFGLLHQYGDMLAQRISQPGTGGTDEIAGYLRLQTLNRFEPQFAHLVHVPVLHPERAYQLALALAGDLAIFDARRRVIDYPEYRHDDLQATFDPLMRDLIALLSQMPDPDVVALELQTHSPSVRVATITDLELVANASFVLAARAQMSNDALRARLPTQVTCGPAERLRDLVKLQLPGIGLRAMITLPRQIPFHAGFSYFELDRGGELWKQLEHTGKLALHIAGEFPALEMELWAILR